MENQKDLNKSIFNATQKIRAEFPELTKYLVEIPSHSTDLNQNGIHLKDLEDYLNSLNELMKNYAEEH